MRQKTEDIEYAEVKKDATTSDNLADNVMDFVETYYKLTLVNITDKASGVASSVVTFMAVFIIGIFVLLFTGLALGTWLGQLLNNTIAGYFLVAGLFLLIMLMIWAFRKKLMSGFRNFIIRKVYE
jgi:ABC-type multidrug transport system permease subunit